MDNLDKASSELPEIIFSSAKDLAWARRVSRLSSAGQIRLIKQGIYTSNLDSPIEAIVTRNWKSIAEHLFGGALLGYRSAYKGGPENGQLFLVQGQRAKRLNLPGLEIVIVPGAPPYLDGLTPDTKYGNLYLSSEPRKLLENLSTSKGAIERALGRVKIEDDLEKILTLRGEEKLNNLRDQAKILAARLGFHDEFKVLSSIIGALLNTHESKFIKSKSALARIAGSPYDTSRIPVFDALFSALNSTQFPHYEANQDPEAVDNFAFFESYFSNFIEGTEFTYEEAEDIVFNNVIIENRPADSHDVKGTFDAIISRNWSRFRPVDQRTFMEGIKRINAIVMGSRPEKKPGEWKVSFNQAGSTIFVAPELVPGTLKQGYDRIEALSDPVARALMTKFVISEVHPFNDGNGRTARIAMNGCLLQAGLSRIIIPTIYREDYLLPLKALTSHADPVPYIRSLSAAMTWSQQLPWSENRSEIKVVMENCNAFEEDTKNYKLLAPEQISVSRKNKP